MSSELPIQEVVIVIIQEGSKFLFQKNQKWHDLSFIGGKIEPTDASPLEAAYRECGEELGVQKEVDYILTPIKPHLYQEQKMSKRTGKMTLYNFYTFQMTIKRDITQKLNSDENVWVEKEEIIHGSESLSEIVKTVFPILNL